MSRAKVSGREKLNRCSRAFQRQPCAPEKVSSLPICPLRRLWRGPVDQHLQLDELAAGALGFIPVVTGVLYAVGVRPRYRENDALTDVLVRLKHDLDLPAKDLQ